MGIWRHEQSKCVPIWEARPCQENTQYWCICMRRRYARLQVLETKVYFTFTRVKHKPKRPETMERVWSELAEPAGGKKKKKKKHNNGKWKFCFPLRYLHLYNLKHSFRSSGCLHPPTLRHTVIRTQCISFRHGTWRCTVCIIKIEPVI